MDPLSPESGISLGGLATIYKELIVDSSY